MNKSIIVYSKNTIIKNILDIVSDYCIIVHNNFTIIMN